MFFRNVAGNGTGHTSRAGPHDHSGSRDADTAGLFTSEVGWVLLYVQKTIGLLGTGAQDGHLDFHTAPELWYRLK